MNRVGWGKAFATVLRKFVFADSDIQKERALKWFLILPFALLREKKRGGKGGRGIIAGRFSRLALGDWGSLLDLLGGDLERKEGRKRNVNVKKLFSDNFMRYSDQILCDNFCNSVSTK